MLTIPRVENDIEKVNQFRALAHKAGSDAVRLRIVERFLCEVDRWLLKLSPPLFDVTLIKNSIHSLKSGGMDDDPSILLEAEFQLQREFQLWRQLIEAKDRNIETYNFRRFCDSSAQPLDSEIFVTLATFYRESPYSQINQSKFDLVITRLFTDVDAAGQRHLRFNPTEIARRAMQFQVDAPADGDRSDRFLDRAGAVAAIHSFIAEAHGLDDFESLIECRLFDRYREFKRELGEQFYEPEIIAAAIQCNVVFSNAFNEMLEAANDNLSEILRPEIDISATLHDPSPEARVHLSDLLNEFFDIDPQTSGPKEGAEGDHIWDLLSLAGAKTGVAEEHADPLTESPRADFDVTQSARERLTPLLETLMRPEPDAGLLLSQLNRSRSLRTLNLSDFLYGENYAADLRSRQILGLILWLEEFVQHELGTQKTLTPTGQQEVLALIQKSEELATNLRSEIQAAGEGSKGRLLVVLNTLLESRLRLEGAIVRFTSRNLSQSQSPHVEVREPKITKARATTDRVPVQVESSPKTRWLPWLLLIGALLAAAYYFYQRNIPAPIPAGNSMVQVESGTLPHPEYIRTAYRRDNTLFVTADEAWTKLPSDNQKAFLKGLLEARQDTPIDNVVLRDAAGHLLGNASVNGIYLPQQAPPDTGNKTN